MGEKELVPCVVKIVNKVVNRAINHIWRFAMNAQGRLEFTRRRKGIRAIGAGWWAGAAHEGQSWSLSVGEHFG
jgi:hypothetical protein